MTKDVITVTPETSVEEVAGLLVRNRIHGVPVLEDLKPVGMITEGDFFTRGQVTVYLPGYISTLKEKAPIESLPAEKQEEARRLFEAKARDIMSSPCVTISEGADTDEFFRLVKEKELNSVPVTDANGSVVGIITLADIIGLLHVQNPD